MSRPIPPSSHSPAGIAVHFGEPPAGIQVSLVPKTGMILERRLSSGHIYRENLSEKAEKAFAEYRQTLRDGVEIASIDLHTRIITYGDGNREYDERIAKIAEAVGAREGISEAMGPVPEGKGDFEAFATQFLSKYPDTKKDDVQKILVRMALVDHYHAAILAKLDEKIDALDKAIKAEPNRVRRRAIEDEKLQLVERRREVQAVDRFALYEVLRYEGMEPEEMRDAISKDIEVPPPWYKKLWAKATIPDSHKEYAAQIALLPTENDPIAHADACETLVIKPYRRRPVDLIFVKLVTGKRGWGDVSNLGLTSGEMQEIMAASLKVTATNLGVADKDTVAGKVKAAVAAMKSK